MPTDTMTIQEAAEYLQTTRQTINNLVRRGKLTKHVRPFGMAKGAQRVYFLRSDVEAIAQAAPDLQRRRRK